MEAERTTNERVAAAMAEIRSLPHTERNDHFGYRFTPTAELYEHIRPVLAKHGVIPLTREVSAELTGGTLKLVCEFALVGPDDTPETTQWERRSMVSPGVKTIQQQAAARTYAMRYWLTGRLLISTGIEQDEEGSRQPLDEALERGRKALGWSREDLERAIEAEGGDREAVRRHMRTEYKDRMGADR